MKRFYGHRITKRERVAIATLYAPTSTQSGIPDPRTAADRSRNVHNPVRAGAVKRQFGDSTTGIEDATKDGTTTVARKD